MNNAHIRTIEDAGRTTAVWSTDVFDTHTHGLDIVRALVPAAVILLVAATLLVTLL